MRLRATFTKAKAQAKALLRTRKGQAIAVAGGVVLVAGVVLLVRRNVVVSIRHYYWQGADPWGGVRVGFANSDDNDYANVGCFATAFDMAYETLAGDTMTPDVMNELLKDANAFSGASLILEKAAAAVGLRAPDSERIHAGQGDVDGLRELIDAALDAGGLAFVHVDKGHTGTGQHFILCHTRTASGYLCADPATAKDTFLDASTLANDAVKWGSRNVAYNAVGVAPIYRS